MVKASIVQCVCVCVYKRVLQALQSGHSAARLAVPAIAAKAKLALKHLAPCKHSLPPIASCFAPLVPSAKLSSAGASDSATASLMAAKRSEKPSEPSAAAYVRMPQLRPKRREPHAWNRTLGTSVKTQPYWVRVRIQCVSGQNHGDHSRQFQ